MVALIFLLIVLPCILIIATFIWFCVLSIDAIYDVGMYLYEGRKPINKGCFNMFLGQIAWNTNKYLPDNDTIILAKLKDEYIYDYELPYVVAKIYNDCIHINNKAYNLKIIDMWAYIEGRTLY